MLACLRAQWPLCQLGTSGLGRAQKRGRLCRHFDQFWAVCLCLFLPGCCSSAWILALNMAMIASATGVSGKRKEIYKYDAPWTIYGMNWSVRPDKRFRLALGSFVEEYNNKVPALRLYTIDSFLWADYKLLCFTSSSGSDYLSRRGNCWICGESDVRPSIPHHENYLDTRQCKLVYLQFWELLLCAVRQLSTMFGLRCFTIVECVLEMNHPFGEFQVDSSGRIIFFCECLVFTRTNSQMNYMYSVPFVAQVHLRWVILL